MDDQSSGSGSDRARSTRFWHSLPTWPTLGRGEARDYRIFRVRPVERRSPRTDEVGTYQVIHVPDWVNVLAVTREKEVVLIEQYRHGTDELTLEIPGGMVDPGEDAGAAAARELSEETGYVGDPPIRLGSVHPNPAIQDNACSTYLIENVRQVAEPDPDPGEHIAVHLQPLAAIDDLVRRGEITHSLVIAAFHWLHLHEQRA